MSEPLPNRRRWDVAAILLSMLALTGFFAMFQNGGFRALDFIDPDDALRLVEVRDWMAGQSWFDVSQHRINPPFGGEMHWWRLLDVPIATSIAFFRLFLGPARAEHVALIVWPLLLYGLFLLMLRSALKRLGDRAFVLTGLFLPLSMVFLARQFSPLRIDHHGWQVVAATALLGLSLGKRTGLRGLLAGLAMAFYLSISLEALPYFLLFGGLYAFAYWRNAEGWPMLAAFLLGCTAGVMLSLPASRGWSALTAVHCDGLSAPYWGALAGASVALILGAGVLGHASAARRFAVLALAGVAALALFFLVAPECRTGPFGALDPLVRQYWYLNVLEGLPLWKQEPLTAVYSVLPSLMGLAGALLALRRAEPPMRDRWRTMLILMVGAFAVSIGVLRAMYVARAFAIPGCAVLILAVWRWARGIDNTALRILASAASVAVVPLVPLAVVSYVDELVTNDSEQEGSLKVASCFQQENIAELNRLAPATFLAPIDIGPSILTDTSHSVIATGHHRNQQAMAEVIGAYLAKGEKARELVTGSHADLLMICQGTQEMDIYIEAAPNGLAAQLARGQTPEWLVPVQPDVLKPYQVYRIVRRRDRIRRGRNPSPHRSCNSACRWAAGRR